MPKVEFSKEKGIVQSAGVGVSFEGSTLSGGLSKIYSVSTGNVATAGDLTLNPADSGSIISLVDTRQGVAIVLPSVSAAGAGFSVDICYAASTPGGDITITGGAGADLFKVIAAVQGAASAAESSGDTLTLTTANSVAGNRCRIFSDGVFFYVRAAVSAATVCVAA